MGPGSSVRRRAIRAALLALVALSAACGASGPDIARGTLTVTAHAVVESDRLFADAYTIADDAAREASPTQAEKDARMASWEAAADAAGKTLERVYAGLAAAEVAIDVWEHTDDATDWTQALACIAEDLRDLRRVLEERGIRVPEAIGAALSFESGACHR